MNIFTRLVASVRENEAFLKLCAEENVVYVHLFDCLRWVPQKHWVTSVCPSVKARRQKETARQGPGSL